MNHERLEDPSGAPLPDVPDVTLERYRLRELPPDEAKRIERLLSHDESLRDRVLALELSDEEILSRHSPDWLARRVAERAIRGAPARRGRAASAAGWAVPAALAATVVLLIFRAPSGNLPSETQTTGRDADRSKGAPSALVIYRSTEAGSETLADDDVVREGDVIRLAYRAAEAGYGAIVSIDGRGVVTFHLPVDGGQAVVLEQGKTVPLDSAFELDDAPRSEIFFLITGPSPFDLAPVAGEVRRAAAGGGNGSPVPLRLPASLNHVTLSLRKETRP